MIELLLIAQFSLSNPQLVYKAEDYEYEYYELLREHEQLQSDYDDLYDKYGDDDGYQPPNYDD